MGYLLKILSSLLVFVCSATCFAQGQRGNGSGSGKWDGPLHVAKNPNFVFFIDPENIPNNWDIGYVENALITALDEFNNIEGSALSMSYGGRVNGSCANTNTGNISEHFILEPIPDKDLFCFSTYAELGGLYRSVTYEDGIRNERLLVQYHPNFFEQAEGRNIVFETTLLHEFGHAAGLGHVTGDVIAAQGFEGGSVDCVDCENTSLQPYDIALLKFMYPLDGSKYPNYPLYCMQYVFGRDSSLGIKGDYYFDYLKYQGFAYKVGTALNVSKLRFDVWSANSTPLQEGRDCSGLEVVDDQILLPYIIHEYAIYQLLLELGDNEEELFLNIKNACQMFPEPEEPCSIEM